VAGEMLGSDRAAEALEDVLSGGGDVDEAVARLEYAGRDAGRVIVAGLAGHILGDQPARRLEIGERDLRLKQRGAHPLALARDLPLEQGDEDTERAKNSGAEIRDRNAGAHRALARQAGDPHQPAHALRNLIEARPLAIRAVLAEAGDAGVDEAPVERFEAL